MTDLRHIYDIYETCKQDLEGFGHFGVDLGTFHTPA